MQSTGLHDKNGKEIFEGDIVKWSDCDDQNGVSKIIWNPDGCWEMKPNLDAGGDYEPTLGSCYNSGEFEIEVLGNVHENPELLKETH